MQSEGLSVWGEGGYKRLCCDTIIMFVLEMLFLISYVDSAYNCVIAVQALSRAPSLSLAPASSLSRF